MQTVIKFKAVDGKLFDNEKDCIAHEKMIEDVKAAMSFLKPTPSDTDFKNGGGFVQQCKEVVSKAMVRIVEIAGIEKRPEFINDPFACRHGVIGRIIDDSRNNHLWTAWIRFMCMDSQYREWGQPYYARNPEEGEQKELATDSNG